jgi:hypothetical protein
MPVGNAVCAYTIKQPTSLALSVHTTQYTLYRVSSLYDCTSHSKWQSFLKVNIHLLKKLLLSWILNLQHCAHKTHQDMPHLRWLVVNLPSHTQVQGQGSPCGVCGGQSGNRTSLFLSALVLCCHYPFTNGTYSYFIHPSLMACNISIIT